MKLLCVGMIVAHLAGAITLYLTWPAPIATVEIPNEIDELGILQHSDSAIRFLDIQSIYDFGVSPKTVTAEWMRWIVLTTNNGSKKVTTYYFIDRHSNQRPASLRVSQLRLDPKVAEDHTAIGFDPRGQWLIETSEQLIRFDPETERQETIPLPGSKRQRKFAFSADGSTLFAVRADKDTPLEIQVYDTLKMTLRNVLEFPDRQGSSSSAADVTAMFDYAISPSGDRIALAESWKGPERISDYGIEVFDTKTGAKIAQVSYPIKKSDKQNGQSEKKGSPPDKKEYPLISETFGHHFLRFSPDGNELQFGISLRRKYGPDYAWQMDGDQFISFDFAQNCLRRKSVYCEMCNWTENYQWFENSSIDFDRIIWLEEFSRWNLKTTKLTDRQGCQLGGWVTFPEEVCSDVSDNLFGFAVPNSSCISIASSEYVATTRGYEKKWLKTIPAILERRLSKTVSLNDRVYLFDFDSGRNIVLRTENSAPLSSNVPRSPRTEYFEFDYLNANRENEVWLLCNFHGKTVVECWPAPHKNPNWFLAALLAVVSFVFTVASLKFARIAKLKKDVSEHQNGICIDALTPE